MSAALVCGLLLRWIFVKHHPEFTGDTLIYGDIAMNWLRHHAYEVSQPALRPTLIRLPGYPAFLVACFALFGRENYVAVLWVQVVVDLVSCLLLGKLAERLWGQRVGMVALWVAALCPFTANYVAAVLAETCSIFCVVAAFFALERWLAVRSARWAVVVGLALSWAVLLRPEQGLLVAAVVGAMLWVQRRERWWRGGAVIASAVVVLPLMAWGVRNWRVFHVVQPLAPRTAIDPGNDVPLGFYRWYRTWGVEFKSNFDFYWQYDGGPIDMKDLPARATDGDAQRAQTAALFARYNRLQYETPAFDAEFAKIAEERVKAHPVAYWVGLPVARELDMWLRPRTELLAVPVDWWEFREHPGWTGAEMAYAGLNLALLAVGAVGIWRWRPKGALGWAMVGFVGLRCLLLLTMDNAEMRYTLECFPVVMLGAALVAGGRKSVARRRYSWGE